HPEPLGLDIAPEPFRARVQEALAAEGVECGQWQRMPVPAQDIFQTKAGYGKGWPWSVVEAVTGERYTYRGEDYPQSVDFLARHFYAHGIWPPNGEKLMDAYGDAFEKVVGSVGELF
ncbi:MAG: DegT/DnrJ/EryC1/StrS family aminotransferase, partial [Armatimonadetes bacterium]|nr:DegT/DnrJ/EryC1/StrS family aminotransferase [Armatimonadota bacterium]